MDWNAAIATAFVAIVVTLCTAFLLPRVAALFSSAQPSSPAEALAQLAVEVLKSNKAADDEPKDKASEPKEPTP